MGWDVRKRCEVLEKRLEDLADRSEGFVDKLNTVKCFLKFLTFRVPLRKQT